jgi:hypothetical protein
MTRWLAVALAAGGCTVSRDVLVDMVTTCPAALAGEPGELCAFDGLCSEQSPGGSANCCQDTAYCANGRLVVAHDCNPDCTPCVDDHQCQRGAAICDGKVCEPCTANPICPTACPAGWVHLQRNGCETCDCAPPRTCDATMPACASGLCYPGAACAAGCAPGDSGCCADECAMPGCPLPVPTGCLATCPPTMTGCQVCATDACTCMAGKWQCTIVCAPGLHSSCIAPPP